MSHAPTHVCLSCAAPMHPSFKPHALLPAAFSSPSAVSFLCSAAFRSRSAAHLTDAGGAGGVCRDACLWQSGRMQGSFLLGWRCCPSPPPHTHTYTISPSTHPFILQAFLAHSPITAPNAPPKRRNPRNAPRASPVTARAPTARQQTPPRSCTLLRAAAGQRSCTTRSASGAARGARAARRSSRASTTASAPCFARAPRPTRTSCWRHRYVGGDRGRL
eukprot:355161-Chlamydomonas_euryale.AAC.2